MTRRYHEPRENTKTPPEATFDVFMEAQKLVCLPNRDMILTRAEASANPFAVIARSESDLRVKPEGRRGNPLKSAPIKEVAASLSLLTMTTGGADN
jgi:hypothetical protein